MEIKVSALAALLNGTIEGNPDVLVHRPSKIEEGGEGAISFLGNPKYEPYAYTTTASALLVSKDFKPRKPIQAVLIRVDDVYAAVSILMEKFNRQQPASTGISDRSVVDPTAVIGQNAFIGPYAVIEEGAVVGDGARIGAQVYVGKNARVGSHTVLHPGVRILEDCTIGEHCIVHANAVIGADGFGFAPQEDGSLKKIPQIGNVAIENHVEIGANCTIDRASLGSTIIREGVKLDNLVHIAHNVEVGAHTGIAAQSAIAGSTKVGKYCLVGGQVGMVGHIQIADKTRIQAQTGVASSVKNPNTTICGYPAIEYGQYLRAHTIFKQLPEIYRRFLSMEKFFKSLNP